MAKILKAEADKRLLPFLLNQKHICCTISLYTFIVVVLPKLVYKKRTDTMDEKSKYWLEMAEYDFETARVMLAGKRFLYVGFMCHQTIEKILKAVYVSKLQENPPHTHNLTYLAQQTRIYDTMSEDQKSTLDILEPLNIEARYPTQKEKLMKTLNAERCEDIVNKAKGLYQWIKNQL